MNLVKNRNSFKVLGEQWPHPWVPGPYPPPPMASPSPPPPANTLLPSNGAGSQAKRPQAPPHSHPTGGGDRDKTRNDNITTNKRKQPYITIPYVCRTVEHTAPHRRGGANQKDRRPHSTGGTRPNKTTQEDPKINKAKQEDYPLDRQGGGGGAAALHQTSPHLLSSAPPSAGPEQSQCRSRNTSTHVPPCSCAGGVSTSPNCGA